ncbi:MAG: SRPBCC family protein [Bacteroidota bacterium]
MYYSEHRQIVDYPIEDVWDFFSKPQNLSRLSPKEAGVKVISPAIEQSMYPGIVVHLRMGPGWAPKIDWYSKITEIQAPDYFVDEQLSGPFVAWHHEHRFVSLGPDRTEIIDRLHYQPPLGLLGALANWLFVRGQVRRIFKYRQEVTKTFDFSRA